MSNFSKKMKKMDIFLTRTQGHVLSLQKISYFVLQIRKR